MSFSPPCTQNRLYNYLYTTMGTKAAELDMFMCLAWDSAVLMLKVSRSVLFLSVVLPCTHAPEHYLMGLSKFSFKLLIICARLFPCTALSSFCLLCCCAAYTRLSITSWDSPKFPFKLLIICARLFPCPGSVCCVPVLHTRA